MKLTRRLICMGFIAAGALVVTAEARADNAFDKLGRGLVNGVLGFVEIPATVCEESRNEGAFIGTTFGFFKGIGHFFAREFVGVYELGTFPVPWPDNYKPYMQPTRPWDRFTSPKETSIVPPPPAIAAPPKPAAPTKPAPAK